MSQGLSVYMPGYGEFWSIQFPGFWRSGAITLSQPSGTIRNYSVPAEMNGYEVTISSVGANAWTLTTLPSVTVVYSGNTPMIRFDSSGFPSGNISIQVTVETRFRPRSGSPTRDAYGVNIPSLDGQGYAIHDGTVGMYFKEKITVTFPAGPANAISNDIYNTNVQGVNVTYTPRWGAIIVYSASMPTVFVRNTGRMTHIQVLPSPTAGAWAVVLGDQWTGNSPGFSLEVYVFTSALSEAAPTHHANNSGVQIRDAGGHVTFDSRRPNLFCASTTTSVASLTDYTISSASSHFWVSINSHFVHFPGLPWDWMNSAVSMQCGGGVAYMGNDGIIVRSSGVGPTANTSSSGQYRIGQVRFGDAPSAMFKLYGDLYATRHQQTSMAVVPDVRPYDWYATTFNRHRFVSLPSGW